MGEMFQTRVQIPNKIIINCMESNVSHACVLSRVSHVQLCVTPWTVAYQAPLSMVLQARIVEWVGVAVPFSRT